MQDQERAKRVNIEENQKETTGQIDSEKTRRTKKRKREEKKGELREGTE